MKLARSLRRLTHLARRLVAGPGWRRRVDREDALRHLHHCAENGLPATMESLAGGCGWERDAAADILQDLISRTLVSLDEGRIQLTDEGSRQALQVVRAHRLWERHLADRTGVRAGSWHRHADRAEHEISTAEADRLAARLGHPAFDPHGDPIPTADGQLPTAASALSLAQLSPGVRGVIAHVEDEPEQVHDELIRAGLHAGAAVERQADDEVDTVTILDEEGHRHTLSAAQAVAISVVSTTAVASGIPLSMIGVGEAGHVVRLGADCHGLERRRLLDLGLVPGTRVIVERRAATGDPTAYRVRGSLVALRRDLAERILVDPEGTP